MRRANNRGPALLAAGGSRNDGQAGPQENA